MIDEIRRNLPAFMVIKANRPNEAVHIGTYIDHVQALLAEIDRLKALNEWRDISTAPKGQKILLSGLTSMGKRWSVFGHYMEKHTVEIDNDYNSDYCEITDCSYWPEGWYEDNFEGDEAYLITLTLTHWMPLPQPPERED